MISKDNVLNAIIDLTAEQNYLDLDNDTIEKYATAIYQRVIANDTTFFGLPFTDTVSVHSIDEDKIRMAITVSINTSTTSRGNLSVSEFIKVKKDWYTSLFRLCADNPQNLYNAFLNIDKMFEDENLDGLLNTGLFNSIYTKKTLLEAMNEALLSRAIITEEKTATFFEDVKKALPKVYLYWSALFFIDNPNYLTNTLMTRILVALNVRYLDVSYFYELFTHVDNEIEDDIEELTEEEIELLL